ncbi:MAG TPA: hypothetical protein VGG28_07125 [Kofleriaceae bacterium]|jgi:hypothetical protein
MACTHRLCERIGGDCSIAVNRSRGCHASGWAKTVAADVLDEVRVLVAAVATDRAAAVRLAQIVRAEALEERSLLAQARDDDPALADLLAPWLVRRDH